MEEGQDMSQSTVLGDYFFKIIFSLEELNILTEKIWKIEKCRGKEKSIVHYFQYSGKLLLTF